MALQKNAEFNGILLYRRNYRESDMLVKFFTREYGTKMFMVRRAQKQGFKLAADILPFTLGKYIGSVATTGLSYIQEAMRTEHLRNISADIELNAYATYMMSLIDTGVQEGEVHAELFDQLASALRLVDAKVDPAIVTNVIEVQMLAYFGVAPELTDCVVCHRTDLAFDYSERYGGLLCQQHWHLDPHRFQLSQRAVFYLRRFSVLRLDRVQRVNVSNETKHQLRVLLDTLYEDTVGIHLKAKRFLDEITQMQ